MSNKSELTVVEVNDYHLIPYKYTVKQALELIMTDHSYNNGVMEDALADIAVMKKVLVKFMSLHVKSLEDLNHLAGWNRFTQKGI